MACLYKLPISFRREWKSHFNRRRAHPGPIYSRLRSHYPNGFRHKLLLRLHWRRLPHSTNDANGSRFHFEHLQCRLCSELVLQPQNSKLKQEMNKKKSGQAKEISAQTQTHPFTGGKKKRWLVTFISEQIKFHFLSKAA